MDIIQSELLIWYNNYYFLRDILGTFAVHENVIDIVFLYCDFEFFSLLD